MGNSVSGLPYEEGDKIVYQSNIWDVSEGFRKTDEKDPVTIFKFKQKKSSATPSLLAIAQRSMTKLRSLKHPYVVSYIDSMDADEDLILVTESVLPLETWLQKRRDSGASVNDIFQEVSWGFRCVLTALDFLHTKGTMTHSFVCLESIYVCSNGDWKLGSFELACKGGVFEDESFMRNNSNHLARDFQPPERERYDEVMMQRAKGAIDIFSLAVCMQKIFNKLVDTPPQYTKYLKAMLQVDIAKRPRAGQILRSDLFKTDYIMLMDKVAEISTKTNIEICDMLDGLSAADPSQLSSFLVVTKVVPAVSHSFKLAIKDFPIRDAREGCRRIIAQGTSLLASYAEAGKLDAEVYEKNFANAMVDMWGMSDRAIRTSLLTTLRYLVPLTPDVLVSKNIFDPMLAGFVDSNHKMREETLKNLVYVLDKIEETQIRDKLLRSINNLQGDQEASLRTNATIFLGKLSSKVAEEVRHRAIYPGFARAMKDPFVHCRIAGLKSTLSCLSIIEKQFFACKLLPQVCALTVDGNSTVRELAISVIEESLVGLKELNIEMKNQQSSKEAERERLGVAEKERMIANNGMGMQQQSNNGATNARGYAPPAMQQPSSNANNVGYGNGGAYGSGGGGGGGGGGYSSNNSLVGNDTTRHSSSGSLDFGATSGQGAPQFNALGQKLADDERGGGIKGMSLPSRAAAANDGWGDDDWDLDISSPPQQQPPRGGGGARLGLGTDSNNRHLSDDLMNMSIGDMNMGNSDGRGGGGSSMNNHMNNQTAPGPMDDPFATLGRPQVPVVTKASPSKMRVKGQKLSKQKKEDAGDWDDF